MMITQTVQWDEQIGKAFAFVATFAGHSASRMLLLDVRRIDGVEFRDHLYLPYTARFKRLGLVEGDIVRIRGKVNRYYKKHEDELHIPRGMGRLIEQMEITNISQVELVR